AGCARGGTGASAGCGRGTGCGGGRAGSPYKSTGTSSQDGWAGDTSGTSSSSCGHRCSHSTTNGGGRCADPVASSEQSSSTDSGRSIQDSRRPPDERRLSSARQSRYREVVLGRS